MKAIKTIIALTLFLVMLTDKASYAQLLIADTMRVDTMELVQARNVLGSLPAEKFLKKTFQTGSAAIPYRFLLPKNPEAGEKYPLVITFHNSSRMGNDNEKQLENLARIWLREDIYNDYKCFVLAPQFNERSSNYEENNDGVLISRPSADVRQILKLIRELENRYPQIDRNRIYLVGYSMGASTAQNLMSLKPGKFTAMVSIAAVPDLSNIRKLQTKPIWLIHGQRDDENPYLGSEMLYRKLRTNAQLIFSTYKNLQHNNIVAPFLLRDDIPRWLFQQRN